MSDLFCLRYINNFSMIGILSTFLNNTYWIAFMLMYQPGPFRIQSDTLFDTDNWAMRK